MKSTLRDWAGPRAVLCLAALLGLGACVQPATDEYVGGVVAESDDEYIARTGFPYDTVVAEDGYSAADADGNTRKFVQVHADLATPAQIAAAPAILCAAQGLQLVSSLVAPPGPKDFDDPDSLVIKAVCK